MTFSHRWNRFIYRLWAPVYDLLLRLHPVSRMRRKAMDLADIADAGSILVVGVGTGADLPFLDASALVIGVDQSLPMLVRATDTAARCRLCFVPVCSDATHLPFGDACFDAVVMTLFASVVPNPRECLQEAMRVVRPGGRLLVTDKFLPAGRKASILRRLLNLVTRPLGTDINRRWELMSAGLGTPVADEFFGRHGSFRVIVLRREATSPTPEMKSEI
ncbi:MAG: class I SAM-dependent methyltransferase [Fuerstiella sp.]